ncbi:MAG: hypothetical protein HY680_09405 [Chloroflexi bacterium]|nr:hypothetical protein [Chloroflexota bacterium]
MAKVITQRDLDELKEMLQKAPTTKEMADFLERATPEQRKEFMQELARLIIDLHWPALKELEHY